MSHDALLALAVYAFVTSISPGPGNFMLLASGANFGFFRTVPQLLGVTLGFKSVLLAVGLGLGTLLTAWPAASVGLKAAGGAYLLYLGLRLATARPVEARGGTAARPLTFLESAAFQWVNPKAWVVAVTAVAVHGRPEAPFLSVAVIATAFTLINLPSVSVWVGFGMSLRSLLAEPSRLRWFNIAMGGLLALSLWPMLRG